MTKGLIKMMRQKSYDGVDDLKPSMARAPKLKRKKKGAPIPLDKHDIYGGHELKYDKRFLK